MKKDDPRKFSSFNLSAPILKAVAEQGYQTPTPIQVQAIPAVLEGKDVMAAAQTGTGKTAGFALPILEGLVKGNRVQPKQARTLILTPTRELAAQIAESLVAYGKYLPLRSTVIFGGVKANPQIQKLQRGVDILVATPGRLLDLYGQKAVKFDQLEVLVLDEADRMLDMGFIHDIRKILALLPKKRQSLMFSATFSKEIRDMAKGMVQNPIEISVSPRNTAPKTVEQWVYLVDKKRKTALLTQLIQDNQWKQVLVFSRTKHGANRLTRHLIAKGINAAAIHSNKSQNARTKALANFKNAKTQILVATDIAARGLDIDQLPQVVNFNLPNVPEDYVHRIGRTGRAGITGQAISLVSSEELKYLSDIEKLIKQNLVRKVMEGFEPVEELSKASTTPNQSRSQEQKKFKMGQRAGRSFRGKSGGHKFGGNKSRGRGNR